MKYKEQGRTEITWKLHLIASAMGDELGDPAEGPMRKLFYHLPGYGYATTAGGMARASNENIS